MLAHRGGGDYRILPPLEGGYSTGGIETRDSLRAVHPEGGRRLIHWSLISLGEHGEWVF